MNGVSLILVQALGGALLHFVWKGALIGIATTLQLRLLRGASPQSRYALVCVAMLLCLLIPLLDVYRYFAAAATALDELNASDVMPALTYRLVAPAPMQHFMPWLVAGWLLGVAAMTARLAAGVIWIHRISSAGRSWAHAQWQIYVSQLAVHWGIRRKISLRVAVDLPGLLTVGWWRPLVLIPAALLTQMPPDLLEALLAHEVAHIKRFDYLVNLLQGLIEALLFYHPVVWWLSKRIRTERERIADDLAVALIGEPQRLALALERLSHLQPADTRIAPVQWATGGGLLDRIRRLVRPNIEPLNWKMLILTIALGVAVTGAIVHTHRPASALSGKRVRAAVAAASNLVAHATKDASLKTLVDLIESNHVVVLDDNSGKVLLQKNADNVVPIASLTKLMTAMVVLDAKPDMNRIIRIDQVNANALKQSRSGLPVGTSLPLREVMQLALMSSDNRAAYALAENYPGGMPAFETAVRAKISALGLSHTKLDEPTGLSPQNTSTATDVAIMANAAARYPEIARYTTYASDIIKISGKRVEYRNTNPFVGQEDWDIQLSKTGFTNEAGRCMIMRLRSAQKNITMVLLDGDRTTASMHDVMNIRRLLLTDAST